MPKPKPKREQCLRCGEVFIVPPDEDGEEAYAFFCPICASDPDIWDDVPGFKD